MMMTAKFNTDNFDEDEVDDEMSPYIDEEYAVMNSPSKVIEETEYLIRSSSSSLEEELLLPDSSSEFSTNSSSILGNKHIVDRQPLLKDMKPRKSVRFDMELNEVSEIEQPELYRMNSGDSISDEPSTPSNEIEDEDDDDDTDDDETDKLNVVNALIDETSLEHTKELLSDVSLLMKEKKKLLREINDLKNRHEAEMEQLREEYQRRRESYYEELDNVQLEVNEKREALEREMTEEAIEHEISRKKEACKLQEIEVDELQRTLDKKREQVLEQELELKEYEQFLDRRHKSLTVKEEDLCTLQDELEEFSDMLKTQEKELKDRKEKNDTALITCTHDDEDIQRTKQSLVTSTQRMIDLQEKLNNKEELLKYKTQEAETRDFEIRKLNTKIKLLESQLSINRTHHISNVENQTNLKLLSRSPNMNSPSKKLHDNNNNNIKNNINNNNNNNNTFPLQHSLSCDSLPQDNTSGGEYIKNDSISSLSPLHKAVPLSSSFTTSGYAVSKTCSLM